MRTLWGFRNGPGCPSKFFSGFVPGATKSNAIFLLSQSAAKFAATMAPSQHAIGVHGGMDIVLHAAMLSLNTFAHRTLGDFQRRNLSTVVSTVLEFKCCYSIWRKCSLAHLLNACARDPDNRHTAPAADGSPHDCTQQQFVSN